jgi:hypothetical protein
MTRGRPVTTALDVAIHIARLRGNVMTFHGGPENFAHLLIRSPGTITFILIRYASHLHGTPEEIEAMYQDTLILLRSVPGSGPLVRELWLYSRYGGWRYFRVRDTGIAEVSGNGEVIIPEPKIMKNKDKSEDAGSLSEPIHPAGDTTPQQGTGQVPG